VNSTFCGDVNDIDANACVGNNGWVDAVTYADGYDIAVRSLCEQALAGKAHVDAAIYPIAFCARHRFELALKSQIKILTGVTNVVRPSDIDVTKVHDLGVLWKKLTELAHAFDRRYAAKLDELAAVMQDFSQIDPTGQTFRYPDDRAGEKHLVETSLVNIRRLYRAYNQADSQLKDLAFLTEQLSEEHALRTRISSLSRRDVEEISKALTPRSEWKNPEFSRVRDELVARYGISRREFSKALSLIQDHREFCVNIGLELPLLRLGSDDVSMFCGLKSELDSLVDARHLPISEQLELVRLGRRPPQPSSDEVECERRLMAWLESLSDDVFAELVAVAEGSQWQFCERYERHYGLVLASLAHERRQEQRKIARGVSCLARLRQGLALLGQTTLLGVLLTSRG
jgi:hypothetical protein